MNSQQRKFLVDRITTKTKERIESLRSSKPEGVSLNMFMFHKVLSNDFEIRSNEELKKIILKKALESAMKKEYREDWLGNNLGAATKNNVAFKLNEFFVIPKEYLDILEDKRKEIQSIDQKIADLKLQLETTEVRIMLASDKTLQNMINEVDDMGDLSLIDTKIKLLN